ncbi:MAG: CTP synthase [Candidatus Freyarchaeota archaeon]|nr:CTP synthase [Candidatus Jordarchaeia archaeon]
MVKYIFVTGGVMSGVGKGVTTASIGKLFQFRGYDVEAIKIDPYLNVDPGTLNPIEHGEVYITEEVWEFKPVEGFSLKISEIDQDFGSYERFLGKNMSPEQNITSGQVYLSVILKEREGEFLGHTTQIIPHITDEIKRRIRQVSVRKKPDILITEVGGTVGDIEAMPFLEAIRQFRLEEKKEDTILIHVTYVPYLDTVQQQKSKPSQHSVRTLQGMGLQPDVLVARAKKPLTKDVLQKLSLFSNIPPEAVISNPDIDVIYELPLFFEQQKLGDYLCKISNLPIKKPQLDEWCNIVNLYKNAKEVVRIAVPGKYTQIVDSYISIQEALRHASAYSGAKLELQWIDTEPIENNPKAIERLRKFDGVLLTPGFGSRGTEGMILTAEYAIREGMPYLGICFGCQLLFVAFCRSVLGLEGANSTEIDPNTPYPVVDLLPEQRAIKTKGGTMRLGGHKVILMENTRLKEAYNKTEVIERFRHRYHIMPQYAEMAKDAGLIVSATDETGKIINAIELNKDFLIMGVQFHPEFKSRPNLPSPVYLAFIKEALRYQKLKNRT